MYICMKVYKVHVIERDAMVQVVILVYWIRTGHLPLGTRGVT